MTTTPLRLYLSALLSLVPFITLVIEDQLGREQPEASMVVLWAVAGIASAHLWLKERDTRLFALLSRILWTAALFIAGAFTIPIYWCLHIYLPTRMSGQRDLRHFVVLTRESNPLRAHMLRDQLVAAGIDVRVHGTEDAAGVGMGQFIVAQRFEVPEAQLQDAREVLDAEPAASELSPELSDDAIIEEPPRDGTSLDLDETSSGRTFDPWEIAIWLILALLTLKAMDMF